MKISQIKKTLRKESAQIKTPDVRERALQEAGCKMQAPSSAPSVRVAAKSPARRRSFVWGIGGALACAAVVLAIALPFLLRQTPILPPDVPAYATVCMRMNPSVELIVEDGKITKTRALNKDAAVLLLNENIVGLTPEQGCLQLADAAARTSFMTDNGVTLLVSGKDEATIGKSIAGALQTKYKVSAPTQSESLQRRADAFGITAGKMSVVDTVLAATDRYSEKELAEMDTEDLLDILEDYDEAAMKEYEKNLFSAYEEQFDSFVREVKTLLNAFIADLTTFQAQLDTMTDEQIAARIADVNAAYVKLSKDFALGDRKSVV